MDTNQRRQRGRTLARLESAVLTGEFGVGEALPSERELAERYGVTRTTVRRALIKLTTAGLLSCQPRIGYTVAPSIRHGRPVRGHAIGVIWPSMRLLTGNSAFLFALEKTAADAGHALMVGASDYDAGKESDTLRRLRAAGMDALVIAPARRGGRSHELERWIADDMPVVLHGHAARWRLSNRLAKQCDQVDEDNRGAVRVLLELLVDRGHRTAGFVCKEAFKGSRRYESFRELGPEIGFETKLAWQVEAAGKSVAGARAAVAELRCAGSLPSALVCSHSDTAMAVIDALREEGVICPRDVSVVGIERLAPSGDDDRDGMLTTVDTHRDRAAGEMLRLLAKQFAGARQEPEHVRIPVSLVEGHSVGAPRAGSISWGNTQRATKA